MTELHTWGIVAVAALVTAALRFLPFLIFNDNRTIPPLIEKLGRILPYAIMGMLVVYCFKGISFASLSGFLPALLAAALVCLLHVWKRNNLLSIIGGTVFYMLLLRTVF